MCRIRTIGTNGEHVPQSIRRGGMSVKYVQNSDNKYVQYRYMESNATTTAAFTNTANWQGVVDIAKRINIFNPNVSVVDNASLNTNGKRVDYSEGSSPHYFYIEKQFLTAGTYVFYAKDTNPGLTRFIRFSNGNTITTSTSDGTLLSVTTTTVNGKSVYEFTLDSDSYVAMAFWGGGAISSYQFGLSLLDDFDGYYYAISSYVRTLNFYLNATEEDLRNIDYANRQNIIDILFEKGYVTDFLNLLDSANCIVNYTLNSSNGRISSYSGRFVTNFIPVEYGKAYTSKLNAFGVFCGYSSANQANFVANGVTVEHTNVSTITIASENVKYIRISYMDTNTTNKVVCLSDLYNDFVYSYHQQMIDPSKIDPRRLDKNKFVTWYKGKKLVVLGDSLVAAGGWVDKVRSAFSFGTYVNCGIGGTTVANNGAYVSENPQWMCSDYRVNTIPTDADVILIQGGANDLGYPSMKFGHVGMSLSDEYFYAAYGLLIKKIITRCPNAKLITLTPPGGRVQTAGQNQDKQFYLSHDVDGVTKELCMTDYATAIKEVSAYYGIPCIDINGESGISTLNAATYIADTIHPNTEGGKLIASVVIDGLQKYEPRI